MEPQEYAAMRQVEDRHWWYQALHARVRQALARHASAGGKLLDTGCGTGGMLASLPQGWEGIGVDRSPLALQVCRGRGLSPLALGGASSLPLADSVCDAVLLLDVLYHRAIEDPVAALLEARRVLLPGGIVVVNVPAYDWLRSSHDHAIHTARRYSRARLAAEFEEAGFLPVAVTHWNTVLLPAAIALRLWRARRPIDSSDVVIPSASMQAIGSAATALERGYPLPLPMGLSILAVARRKP